MCITVFSFFFSFRFCIFREITKPQRMKKARDIPLPLKCEMPKRQTIPSIKNALPFHTQRPCDYNGMMSIPTFTVMAVATDLHRSFLIIEHICPTPHSKGTGNRIFHKLHYTPFFFVCQVIFQLLIS